mgnify:CR=1 FL=1|tara:strand:- start:1 stop:711 length:711 start_codon:yes stop_codon:yes gene_type:complete
MRLTENRLKKIILEILEQEQAVKETYFTSLNMLDDGALEEAEELEVIVSTPTDPNEEVIQAFMNGIKENPRSEFITKLSYDQLRSRNLVITQDKMTGMATEQNGHMGTGWNNKKGHGGRLMNLMHYSRDNLGGKIGDHLDGRLSSVYRNMGLNKVSKIIAWDDAYAPKNWNYRPIDIFDPKLSAYAEGFKKANYQRGSLPNKIVSINTEGLTVEINPYEKAVQYSNGKPDIIFRKF